MSEKLKFWPFVGFAVCLYFFIEKVQLTEDPLKLFLVVSGRRELVTEAGECFSAQLCVP